MRRSIGVVATSVFLLVTSAWADAVPVPTSFGQAFNNPNNLNAGSGSGAEVLCTNWQNTHVQNSATWTNGANTPAYSLTISNQTATSGASSFWNPTPGSQPGGVPICQGKGKTYYYNQNIKITGLNTLGWPGVDIYLYGANGNAEIVSTNPGTLYGGTVVTNGGQQTTVYSATPTTYQAGVNYLKWSNISPASTLYVTIRECSWSGIQVVSTPEPTTLALLALSGLAVLRRRR